MSEQHKQMVLAWAECYIDRRPCTLLHSSGTYFQWIARLHGE